jgi:choline dehydrogenase
MPDKTYDYIIVGSGAGGGPLAANLAVKGFRVCLIEAGGDPEPYEYQVPSFHALSTEVPEMAWSFYVDHYRTDPQRDKEKYVEGKGILYPRAGTLGGCTAHNAMITVVPHDSDWDEIAKRTNDPSWHAENMWQYWQRVERCEYRTPPPPGERDPAGHGYGGWLHTSTVPPTVAAGDHDVLATVFSALSRAARRFWYRGMFRRIWHYLLTHDDPNDIRNRAAYEGVTTTIPLATFNGKRNGTRELIRAVCEKHPDRLFVKMGHLATRVILDDDKRAVGVECRVGKNLYRAGPNAAEQPQPETKEYRCAREVILAGGAFNTPQLLMLSGIGPKEHLEDSKIGIKCLVDRPGVGSNLQDRYEVGIVSEMKRPFSMLKDATFRPPGPDNPPDPPFREWQKGEGLYTSNGSMAAIILRSDRGKPDPDLFIFALPGNFHGYFPRYAESVIDSRKNSLTWAIVKAHTNNTAGTVRLRSSNPLDTPEIDFHYFEEGNDASGEDLAAVVRGVKFIRSMNHGNGRIKHEVIPGADVAGDDALGTWIKNNAWGHHASCSCKMGHEADPMAVVDSRFRVIGTKGLRIVDASVFPRIPGFFIVTPIYMISEKAADVITEDAAPLTHA